MRKEIIGILLFFLVILTLISLLSYSPADPSINTATSSGHIHNFFGLLGAHLAGILIGPFGLGAFWIPILLLLTSIHFFRGHPSRAIVFTITGGILLVVTTGSLLAINNNHIILFGNKFSSGGIVGIFLKSFLVKYSNVMGAAIILVLLWIIGLIMATGFSLTSFSKRSWRSVVFASDRLHTLVIKWKERRKKSKKTSKIKKERALQKEQKIKIKVPRPKPIKEAPVPRQEVFEFMRSETGFKLPSINLLDDSKEKPSSADDENLRMQSKLLEKKLDNFSVKGKVVAVSPGPVITTFEYEPAPGVKINKIVNLTDDLSLALRATSIRIVAPIPGKAVIGIELPNATRELVKFKGIVASSVFEKSKSKLTICLGKSIVGDPVVAELDRMPHLLIAGATGTGKSVALNAMICSLLYKSTPDEVKLIMIDPKRIELSHYDGIPHLIAPVVTDVKKATNALFWAVREMETRYELLSEKKSRNIRQYNQKIVSENTTKQGEAPEKLPYVVVIIDELADLMLAASRDVEVALTRLAQMARAAGIHLILATQRPSVDVLTGIIKANFPTRLTFQVSSKTDSRTIIDTNGAENLLGNGDMLFLPPGTAKLQRIHGAFISEAELSRITDFLKAQKAPEYNTAIVKSPPKEEDSFDTLEYDERYDDAVALITKSRQASISMIQRHLRIGYNRAARIIEVMEKEGIVGPSDGAKPRQVLVKGYDEIP
ncbi:MAG: DNA translocase FtsK 4TM domain-containing protein [Deltaproteobacteria bacterium]|nr:DNA translocase FtsK 4TM domain-containing protein [Deltaproteobacteria bacterium]MBW2013589.1 DNA translocase FtsK 4TM domain-containing protein [Deltaproteobacteria bacterium]MBW2089497.1 DNA translocase FtsK 4TM domain-containing protein [Deltaproteobacteria bacterium]